MSHESENAMQAAPSVAPWITPGPEKEAWKTQGNLCDFREIEASRPADLIITISGPRQFSNL